jgi:hypothetical protein
MSANAFFEFHLDSVFGFRNVKHPDPMAQEVETSGLSLSAAGAASLL